MRTLATEMFGVDLPLFAFSHCRDVVAAVTNAGGFGVLGASGYSPGQLEEELTWIDEHVTGRPYGLDVLIPENLAGKGEGLSIEQMQARVPSAHREFVRALLEKYGVPSEDERLSRVRLDESAADGLLDVAFRHPIKLIASALGVPPASMVERAKAEGVPVAALVGAKEHALRQVEAGVDLLVAQGTEAGGHCGEVTTMVLIPEVVRALRSVGSDVPVLAAGGIVTGEQMAASLALGAAGVWTGSVWLTTDEAETAPHTKQKMVAAGSRDTVRSKARTGKPARQLRSAWHDAWESPDSPEPLPMPFMPMLSSPAMDKIDRAAEKGNTGAQVLSTYFVGQGVGLMNAIRPVREVVYEIASDLGAALERLDTMTSDDAIEVTS